MMLPRAVHPHLGRSRRSQTRGFALFLALEIAACNPSDNAGNSAAESPAAAVQEERPALPPAADAALEVGQAFSKVTVRGLSGGPVDATKFGERCVGQTGERANVSLRVAATIPLTFSAKPLGQGVMDLSLALVKPTGDAECADDALTLDPVLGAMLEPGDYQLFVAASATTSIPYELVVEAGIHTPDPIELGGRFPPPIRGGVPAEITTLGTFGGVRLLAGTAPASLTGHAGGTKPAIEFGPDCKGFVSEAPDHVIEVTAPEDLMLRVRAEGDTTMVLLGPTDTVICADDEDGLNPVIRRTLSPGTWSVFIGGFDRDAGPNYTLSVSR